VRFKPWLDRVAARDAALAAARRVSADAVAAMSKIAHSAATKSDKLPVSKTAP